MRWRDAGSLLPSVDLLDGGRGDPGGLPLDLRPGAEYDPLYQSALCRQKADWLIGINATRLFSVLYHRTLNVGRVQTPTLAMLVDRDSKITMFRKEKYHHVRLTFGGAEAVSEKITAPEEAGDPAGGLCWCGGGLRFRHP